MFTTRRYASSELLQDLNDFIYSYCGASFMGKVYDNHGFLYLNLSTQTDERNPSDAVIFKVYDEKIGKIDDSYEDLCEQIIFFHARIMAEYADYREYVKTEVEAWAKEAYECFLKGMEVEFESDEGTIHGYDNAIRAYLSAQLGCKIVDFDSQKGVYYDEYENTVGAFWCVSLVNAWDNIYVFDTEYNVNFTR